MTHLSHSLIELKFNMDGIPPAPPPTAVAKDQGTACVATATCLERADWFVATNCGCRIWQICHDHFERNAARVYAIRSGALAAYCTICDAKVDMILEPTRPSNGSRSAPMFGTCIDGRGALSA